ncbi:13006_t:CDS:1, partial [Funneliformis caledonium]
KLAMVTADLSQDNDIASVLLYNANLRCRSCKATKNEYLL